MCQKVIPFLQLSRRALHKAAINGRCDLIEALLESGEDVDQTDKFGLTPLHLAAWYGQRAVVKLLLQHGANVNAVDGFQKIAIQKAERNNHRAIVRLLLKNEASPGYNQPLSLKSLSRKAFLHVDARSGFNRLQAAVFHGDLDTVWKAQCYLENHVQHMHFQKTGNQVKVFPGKTAFEILFALQEKGEEHVRIRTMYEEYVEKIDTLSELHLCRGSDDAEKAVEMVLNEGVEIDIPGKSNRTPLMWASASSSCEFVQTLIDLGAEVNTQRPSDNVTSLNVAVFHNNYVAVKILLNHGAKMGIQDNYGELPLHDSARGGSFNVSKLLIDSGCDINARNNNEETPLYVAVKNKHVHLVKCLLKGNADVNIKYCKENARGRICLVRGKDKAGKLAWNYVLVQRALLPLFMRQANGSSLDVADFGEVLKSGWGMDPPKSVREEIREIEKTLPDMQGVTILHFACKSASLEIVNELVVKCKSDINTCDGEGYTPLHLAAMHGTVQVVKKLVELNADVNLKVDGNDAADLAHMNEETEIEEFLKSKRSSPLKDSGI